jgi:hypothetical protein
MQLEPIDVVWFANKLVSFAATAALSAASARSTTANSSPPAGPPVRLSKLRRQPGRNLMSNLSPRHDHTYR